jgi:alkylhydroperoxidase family enzyme
MSEPRIPPRPTADWDDEVDAAMAVLLPPRPDAPVAPVRPEAHILGLYAWHPDLVRGWAPFSRHLRHSSLPDRIREIAIVRTARISGGEYEWVQHVRMSRASEWLTDEELEALEVGPDDPSWSPEDAAVVRAVDEMVRDRRVMDTTWNALAERFDRAQLIDLVFTVGTYDMHAMAFSVLGLELEPDMDGFPQDDAAPWSS